MKVTARQYATLLYEMVADVKKSEMPDRIQSFLQYLVRTRRTALVESIITAFETVCNEYDKVRRVDVTSASKLSKTVKEELRSALGAEKLDIHESIDTVVIGGLRLRVGDTIIDGTIKNKLDKMKEALSS